MAGYDRHYGWGSLADADERRSGRSVGHAAQGRDSYAGRDWAEDNGRASRRDTNYFAESYGSRRGRSEREPRSSAVREDRLGRIWAQRNDRGSGTYSGRDDGAYRRGERDGDRGFFDRAGDEVRSWFGGEEAERSRRLDRARDDRERRYRARGPRHGGCDRSYERGRGQSGDARASGAGRAAAYHDRGYAGGDR